MKLKERDFSAKQRKSAKKSGAAMSDGSYPIYNQEDANNAWKLRGKSKNHSESSVVAHIRKRVKALGLKMPGSDSTRESDPAAQAGASEEVRMKPAMLQEKIKASVAKLREASQIEDDDERAEHLIEEALGELDECAETTVSKQVEVREVEKPVAAGDSDADKLAVELEQTKTRLSEAETRADESEREAREAKAEAKALRSAQLAAKVIREAELPKAVAEDWFNDIVAQPDEESMVRLVERKKAAMEEWIRPIRESVGVEGAPPRIPSLNGTPATGGGLLERMGIDRDELAA